MIRRPPSALAWWALALIAATSFAFMFSASRSDSAIMDELAHIPAGYGYVHNLDYRLNPEHPPLVKALAELPVLLLGPTFPTASNAWRNEINAQWEMGAKFLYEAGNDATAIVETSRIFPIIITLLALLYTYLIARAIMGNWWALLPAALFGLSPTVLAHGHYVTTDVGAAFGILFSTYYFLRYADEPSRKRLWIAGLAFGVAQLAKFSTPFLVPLFIFLAFVLWIRNMVADWRSVASRFKTFFGRGLRWIGKLIAIFAIGYVFIVYPVYGLFTVNYPMQKQVADTTFILGSFANGPTPAGQSCHGLRCLADLNIALAKNNFTRPLAQYMLGILMVLQRADGGNTIYYMGHVENSGGWTYFPTLYLLKETVPTLIIVLVGLALGVWWTIKRDRREGRTRGQRIMDYLAVSFAEFAMISFVVLYWGYSVRSPLNIGIRHLMPTIPLIYILASNVWKKWVTRINFPSGAFTTGVFSAVARSFVSSTIKYAFLALLLVWLMLETLGTAPYFLSYFNEFGGGTWNGYHYVTDSNYDWGQDLLRLRDFVDKHPEIDKIAVDYFGGGNPHYYLGDKEVNWSSSKGNPSDQGIYWLAVSVNTLQGAIQPLGEGQTRNASDTYEWLTATRPPAPGMGNVPPPDYRAGTSIFIYKM